MRLLMTVIIESIDDFEARGFQLISWLFSTHYSAVTEAADGVRIKMSAVSWLSES